MSIASQKDTQITGLLMQCIILFVQYSQIMINILPGKSNGAKHAALFTLTDAQQELQFM